MVSNSASVSSRVAFLGAAGPIGSDAIAAAPGSAQPRNICVQGTQILASFLNPNLLHQRPEMAVDYVVLGGGVVGLAVARRLSQIEGKTTVLIERHKHAGEETSSRNSEVIHAGLYYPPASLKTRLCIRGRDMLYSYCERNSVPFRKVGKLVVATDTQIPYITNLHEKARRMQFPAPKSDANAEMLPTQLISGAEARRMEPDLSENISGALWSPETGIVDSHSLMQSLEKDILESGNADIAYSTTVVRVDPFASNAPSQDLEGAKRGWVVQTLTGNETASLFARTVINATGLRAPMVVNSLLPEAQRMPMYFARGSYAKYTSPSLARVSHLIYPCPETSKSTHGFQSLGTHLTLDLQGNVRFGPDIEWISPPGEDPDFWRNHLVADDSRLEEMYEAVTKYLSPGAIDKYAFSPDYVGIRPKIVGPQGGFQDFFFRKDFPDDTAESSQRPLVSLLGIESPGLTASLAIAEHVVDELASVH
ncbi:Delta-9 fatty acid desaturase protein [Mycena kentingensis (nom. inval.)]|nr:Delta-9 fatty acid desaturase protein [Mycena kentingensis (nom. inval.)]